MSISNAQQSEWLGKRFWERLEQLERQHQCLQSEHDQVSRRLKRVNGQEAEELRIAWRRYCEVITELEKSSAEFSKLRA